MGLDRRYTATACECGDAFCAGCEDAEIDRDELGDENRLFIGCYPAGLVYADRFVEERGDYKTLAFLSYSTLELEWRAKSIPADLRERIEQDAISMQSMRGQQYSIAGNMSVTLGQ